MGLEELVNGRDVDFTKHTIASSQIAQMENLLGVKIGSELREYILKYGYLGYEDIELYGINSRQYDKSDMITQTTYLHKYFYKIEDYIGLENLGDGTYIVVDAQDNVYRYDSESDELNSLGIRLFDYITKRFMAGE